MTRLPDWAPDWFPPELAARLSDWAARISENPRAASIAAGLLIGLCLLALGRAFWLEVKPPPKGAFYVEGGQLTDGDSLRLGGESWRLTGRDGPFNAPETRAGSKGRDGVAVTAREAEWGAKATEHGRKLLRKRGAVLLPTGKRERYGRPLATIRLSNGRDYGAEMVRAGLATPTERREHDHWNSRRP